MSLRDFLDSTCFACDDTRWVCEAHQERPIRLYLRGLPLYRLSAFCEWCTLPYATAAPRAKLFGSRMVATKSGLQDGPQLGFD